MLVFAASAAAMLSAGMMSSAAQAPQKEEREIEDTIPKHLPLKVRVRNAEKVKDLDNEKWARDLEIEIENTSDKPIYHIHILVSLPGVRGESGHEIGFPISYGRDDFVDYFTPIRPDDVPLRKGESHVFRIPSQLQQGWEKFVVRRGVPKREPKRIQLIFSLLSFGDGTGFDTVGGLPFDVSKKPQAACPDGAQGTQAVASPPDKPPTVRPGLLPHTSAIFLPASFLPVKLFLAVVSGPTLAAPHAARDVCCPGSPCSRVKTILVSCYCGTVRKAVSSGCTDPTGRCTSYTSHEVPCHDEFGTYCIQDVLDIACVPGRPSPSPPPPCNLE